ncbi:GAF domain-containing protein [Flavobacterium silvaticum]|uniref:histidine kinase n=1 Tax=Flavobacterium silvaticum TaxID=1852020 RepID=A0A972FJX1_9FLAO|nr:GAF domain-containing protein [Flavobacterium silvaticum]NMH26575.1 PAS domain S-box protein [Flavobacterium silvaticum]
MKRDKSGSDASPDSHSGLLRFYTLALWEAAPNGAFLVDSPAWRKFTGQSFDQWKHFGWLEAIHEDDRTLAVTLWRRCMESGQPIDLQFRLFHKADTAYKWVNAKGIPVFDSGTAIAKWTGMLIDIQDRKETEFFLIEERQKDAFLVRLSDALTLQKTPEAIKDTACRMLATQLQAMRAVFAERTRINGRDYFQVTGQYGTKLAFTPDPVLIDDYLYSMSHFFNGNLFIIRDILRQIPRLDRLFFTQYLIRSFVSFPLIKNGKPAILFSVHDLKPRQWKDSELNMIQETAERAWAAIQRCQTEEGTRQSEEQYRTLFETLDQGYGLLELIYDDLGEIHDYLYLAGSPDEEKWDGLKGVIGRNLGQLAPTEPYWKPFYQQVAATGKSEKIDYFAENLNRWFCVQLSRVGGKGSLLINAVFEDITTRKISEIHREYLLKLSDALTGQTTSPGVKETACRILGQHLGMMRVLYVESIFTEGTEFYVLKGQYAPDRPFPSQPILATQYLPRGQNTYEGNTIVVSDVHDVIPEPDREPYELFDIRSYVVIPYVVKDQPILFFIIHHDTPKNWTESELIIIKETAERMWAAVKRFEAEEALRESEQRYRTLAEKMKEGYALLELEYDDSGKVVDFVHLEVNSVMEKLTRLKDSVGKRISELGLVKPAWLQLYERVAATGHSERIEFFSKRLHKWFSIHASRVGTAGSRLINVIFDDITERKNLQRRQDFLLTFSDELRPLSDPFEIQEVAMRLLGEHLDVGRAFYLDAVWEDGGWTYVLERDFHRDPSAPSVVGRHRLSDYHELVFSNLEKGHILQVDNIKAFPDISAEAIESYVSIELISFLIVPLIKDGIYVGGLSVQENVPRIWTTAEVEIVSEVAERIWSAVERAKAEAALRESEERYRTIFEGMDNDWIREQTGKTSDSNKKEV